MPRHPKTPHGFPDLPAKQRPFPSQVSRSTTLVELVGWWLEARCTCSQRHYNRSTPFRLMAAELGWTVQLGDVLDRLTCHGCGASPAAVDLVEDPAGGSGRARAPEPKRLSLKSLIQPNRDAP